MDRKETVNPSDGEAYEKKGSSLEIFARYTIRLPIVA